jgi:hypothetical protein
MQLWQKLEIVAIATTDEKREKLWTLSIQIESLLRANGISIEKSKMTEVSGHISAEHGRRL